MPDEQRREEQRAVLVVDPEFGERLRLLADWGPAWVIDSDANRAAAERWSEREWDANGRLIAGVTFVAAPKVADAGARVEALLREMGADEYRALTIAGARPTGAVLESLTRAGFLTTVAARTREREPLLFEARRGA